MKQNFLTKSFAIAIAAMMTFTGCYDDSDLQTRMDQAEKDIAELQQLVKDINTNISSLVTVVDALKNSDQITSVTPLSDGSGYTITFSKSGTITIYNGKNGVDGTNGTNGANGENGADGHTPVISVKLDQDGQYYWTVDGEYLTDADGKKIPATAHVGVPQIKIEGGKFIISYNGGVSWEVIGDSGATGTVLFMDVIDDEDAVVFKLTDGTTITVPKSQEFALIIENRVIAISAGSSVEVMYTINAADETTAIDGFATGGYTFMIDSYESNRGSIIIDAPDPYNDGKVFLFAFNSSGVTSAQVLTFELGQLTVVQNAEVVPAEGGDVTIELRTNLQYEFDIPFSDWSWVEFVDVQTKAMRNDVATFRIKENTTGAPRSSVISVVDFNFNPITTFEIVQNADNDNSGDDVVSGGSADMSTMNGGQWAAEYDTYTSQNGWSAYNSRLDLVNDSVCPDFNGKADDLGYLTSPMISGGLGTLTVKYQRSTLKKGVAFKIDVNDTAGNIIKTETFTNVDAGQYELLSTSFDFNVSGDFTVNIYNQRLSTDSTKDGLTIVDVTWTGYSE